MANNIIKVNHLPVLTWNRLKINSSEAYISKTSENSIEYDLPASIRTDSVDFITALSEFEALSGSVRRESFVSGKVPIYNEQAFITGMGKEADDYLASSGADIVIIDIPAEVNLSEPLKINVSGESSLFIKSGAGSAANIVIDAEKADFLSVRIFLNSGSQINISVSRVNNKAQFMTDFGAYLQDSASLELYSVLLGAEKIYCGIGIDMTGDNSRFKSELAYLRGSGEDEDINYNIIHRGRNTESEFNVRGVLLDGGSKTLRDTIDFRRGASGARGNEQENVLLATEKENSVFNKSVPLILCEEEDVDGRHGASIGRIDPKTTLYMESRGFTPEEARRLLIHGHIGSVARSIPDKDIYKAVEKYIEARI
ncbi:MAG: SufD family Fe-S cluster assembly protein [Clostridiales bacterium]|jgi:Fe-S cluster assembly scaffold protein SufB|nr:SufD family Fe-S cluster assembly protein [Clostridiales bacterium]